MLDPAIENFLSERKVLRIKEKSKSCKSDEELQQVEINANEEFSLASWLPKAAKRAGRLSITTHPCTYTHPSSRKHPDPEKKTTGVITNALLKADGFLRSGNSEAELDVFGDASALDVYKLLSIHLEDGRTVLEHLEQDTDVIKHQFTFSTETYKNIRMGLLAMKPSDVKTYVTSEKVKQVYFPVDDNYHLLSLLTPSGLIFSLKEKINHLRFSDEAKQAREDRKADKENKHGFSELYNLAVIGFGGANKQNISNLNSKHGGTAYLLPSLPPQLEIRTLRRPKESFFLESLYFKEYQESFKSLHDLLAVNYNNINIRDGRDNIIVFIAEQVMEKVWQFRQLEADWTEKTSLPQAQKIWLDAAFTEQRESESEWLDDVMSSFVRWFRIAYEKSVGKDKAIFMGDVELAHIKALITDMAENLR